MRKIIIKEIDRLQSKLFKDKVVSEYLMYYIENDIKINTSIQLGEEARENQLCLLFEKYCTKNDRELYHDIIIEIIKFEDHKNKINE